MLNQEYRGIGQTELMIANLPSRQCTIVSPSVDIGREIAARVHKANPGNRRYVTVRHPSDVQKLSGLCEPIFFDHSFFGLASKETAARALEMAIPCSRMASRLEAADA